MIIRKLERGDEVKIIIKDLAELKLVGYRVLCEAEQYIIEIPQATRRLFEQIKDITAVVDPFQLYGAFVVDNETKDEDGYWVCVEVSDYKDIPTEMVALTIPRQSYAVVRHKGKNSLIGESYNQLHKWIEENGYKRLKNKWHLEKYHSWEDVDNIDVELLDTIE